MDRQGYATCSIWINPAPGACSGCNCSTHYDFRERNGFLTASTGVPYDYAHPHTHFGVAPAGDRCCGLDAWLIPAFLLVPTW